MGCHLFVTRLFGVSLPANAAVMVEPILFRHSYQREPCDLTPGLVRRKVSALIYPPL